ncbi:hypothetical protein BGP76_08685 [Reichenbachiella sp. MSK19-1]|nr:hypothetical protein BGP76_08685 [Reichenbachiella sp. MSK19-1]
MVQSNDTLRANTAKQSVYSAGLPYFEDFEVTTDTVYVGSQGGLEGLSGWSFVPDTDNGNLSIGTYSGNETRAMKLAREESIYEFTVNLAVLTLDLSDKSVATDDLLLDFDFSQNSAYPYAENKVYVRGSTSDDWIILYDWYANAGNNYEWIVVNSLAVSDTLAANDQDFSATFQLRFGEKEDYASDAFLLDNVHVYERPAHELAVVDLEVPASSPLLGVAEQITVQYVNQGVSTETSVPLTVWIDGPSGRQEVSETAAISLATGDTLIYTFTADMGFSEAGNYEVTVISELSGDLVQSNDTLRANTAKQSIYSAGLPYFEDFEATTDTVYVGSQGELVGLAGWSYSSNADNGRLTLGASTNSSGVAMALGRSSSYGNAINHAILTIDMNEYSAVDDDILIDFRFSQRYESSYTEDRVHIRGSASDEWIMLYDWSANKGATNEWITVNAYSLADSLSAHDQDFSSTFQIRFGEREYGTDAFYLDDIKVYQRYAHDMTATGLTVPEASVQLTATESITVELVNDGSSTETSVPLVAWIDGPNGRQEVAETASVSMAYDGTTSYTFESLVDLSAPGNYSFTVFSKLTGEANVMNDTIRSSTEHYSVYTGELPYLADFESVEEAIYTTNQGELSGLSGWSYTIDNGSGLLSIGSHDANDTRSLQLTGSEDALNQARFTINLSQYDVANDEILFDIDFAMGADVSASQNKIFIRGSEDDEWIVFYDWGLNGTAGEFVEVRGLPIAQLLADNDQNFSATFQFRLDQMSTSNEFNLTVDNMSIYELPGLNARAAAVVASTGTEAYIGLGSNGTKFFNDFWKTDAENEFSIQLAEYPGVARDNAVSFMIGDLLYVGTGSGEDDKELSDFYVYDPAVDTWSTIADFGGGARTNAVGFALDGYGYVGTGYGSGDEQSDFWKYDPVTDTWIEVAGLGVDKRQSAFAFVIDGKAYVGGGLFYDDYSVQLSDIKAYDPSTDVWIEKIDADGINLSVNNAATFTAYGKGYITYGNKEKIVSYDPVTNEVENLGDFLELGETRVDPVAFMLGDQPYFGLGYYGFFETVYSDEVVPLTGFNFAPVDIFLSAESMSENNAIDALIGTLTVEDPSDENSHTYSLVSDGVHDSNNDQVYILGSNLYAENSFDYETQPVIQFYLKVTDSHGASFAKAFELNVLDENEQPSSIQISSAVVEESPTGESLFVGVFTVLDDDVSDTHVYSILTGDTPFTVKDDSLFVTAPDFETQTSYELSIQATDAGDLTVNAQFEITILDVNEAMTEVEFDSDSFAEDLLVNDYVGSFTVVDPDANETFTYSFVEDSELGADNDSFYINTDDLFLSSRFNFEEQSEANILVRVTDNGGHFVDLAIVLTVTDANDLITDIVFIQTYTPISTIIPGQTELGHVEFSDEDLEDSYSYQIISANRDLSINAEGGVAANSNFSIFSGESMTFTVEVTDASGELFQQEFSIASGDLVLGTGTKNLLIEMYPNPVLSQLTISAPEADRLEVYTLTGVLVRDEQIGGQTVQLDCSALQAGVYLVRLYDGNQYSTYRLIKE